MELLVGVFLILDGFLESFDFGPEYLHLVPELYKLEFVFFPQCINGSHVLLE